MKAISILLVGLILLCCKQPSSKKDQHKIDSSHLIKYDSIKDKRIISYQTDTKKIQFFLKDHSGKYFNNHGNLEKYLTSQHKKLFFAMNGGMYLEDFSPQGLYIENGIERKELNTQKDTFGNFYLQPNGVFYILKNGKAVIIPTQLFKQSNQLKYATQSGPMLLINGKMHPAFTKNSNHIHIRNGVGILANGDLLFAMSKDSINFYDFASYFESKGCKNALYLDGAISKTFLPSKGVRETSGQFGVIIAEVK